MIQQKSNNFYRKGFKSKMFLNVKSRLSNAFQEILLYRNAILNIKINIYSLFYMIIFLLPLIQTELRIRVGAGWQLYVPLIFLLFLTVLVKRKKFYNYFIISLILIFFTMLANIFGYFEYKDFILNEDLLQQIQSIEARLFVENVRFIASIFFFTVTFYLVKNYQILIKSLNIFLYAVLFQSLYGIYELIGKILIPFLPLINQKAYSHGSFRIFGTFYEPSQYGQFMLIGILSLVLYVTLINIYSQNKVSDFFIRNYKKILMFFFISFFLSLSRAAFLIGIIVLIIYFLNSLNSLKRIAKFLTLVLVISIFMITYINVIMSSKEFDTWLFLLTSDSGNGLIARIYMTLDNFKFIFTSFVLHPFGVGNGLSIIENGMVPFLFRFFLELGIVIGIFYLLFIVKIYINNKLYVKNKIFRLNVFMLLVGLLIMQMNYNSINDPWIWFLLALLYRLPKIIYGEKLQK